MNIALFDELNNTHYPLLNTDQVDTGFRDAILTMHIIWHLISFTHHIRIEKFSMFRTNEIVGGICPSFCRCYDLLER